LECGAAAPLFWSVVLLHRFSAPVEKQKGFPLIRVAFMFPK